MSSRKRCVGGFATPRHPAECQCAGDGCGQAAAERAARRRTRDQLPLGDDVRIAQLARGIGLIVRRRLPG